MNQTDEKYLVLHAEGGLGKNIALSALIRPLKEKYADRKLILVVSYPELFLNDPNVYRVYGVGNTPYFYDSYIKGKDTIVLRKEPYYENDHIMRKKPLMETWFEMYGVNYNPNLHMPTIHMNMLQQSKLNVWKRDKPIFLIHTNGGPFATNMQQVDYAWTRDMPPYVSYNITKDITDKYHVIQVCRDNSYKLPNAEHICKQMNMFDLFAIVLNSEKRLLIDSCLQHAAAGFGLTSTVLWVGTKPDMFGYSLHDNIIASDPSGRTKLVDSYLFDYEFNGFIHQCPYNSQEEMFDLNKIKKSVNI